MHFGKDLISLESYKAYRCSVNKGVSLQLGDVLVTKEIENNVIECVFCSDTVYVKMSFDLLFLQTKY